MKLLLDTHVLIWWVEDDPRLSKAAAEAIENAEDGVLFSAASIWEIATKVRIGKLRLNRDLSGIVQDLNQRLHLEPLAISVAQAQLAEEPPDPHKARFDRMFIAQARLENLTVVTVDPVFRRYRVRHTWIPSKAMSSKKLVNVMTNNR
jgi:PIN domain nuclease of toxin-antitoxin system